MVFKQCDATTRPLPVLAHEVDGQCKSEWIPGFGAKFINLHEPSRRRPGCLPLAVNLEASAKGLVQKQPNSTFVKWLENELVVAEAGIEVVRPAGKDSPHNCSIIGSEGSQGRSALGVITHPRYFVHSIEDDNDWSRNRAGEQMPAEVAYTGRYRVANELDDRFV